MYINHRRHSVENLLPFILQGTVEKQKLSKYVLLISPQDITLSPLYGLSPYQSLFMALSLCWMVEQADYLDFLDSGEGKFPRKSQRVFSYQLKTL